MTEQQQKHIFALATRSSLYRPWPAARHCMCRIESGHLHLLRRVALLQQAAMLHKATRSTEDSAPCAKETIFATRPWYRISLVNSTRSTRPLQRTISSVPVSLLHSSPFIKLTITFLLRARYPFRLLLVGSATPELVLTVRRYSTPSSYY